MFGRRMKNIRTSVELVRKAIRAYPPQQYLLYRKSPCTMNFTTEAKAQPSLKRRRRRLLLATAGGIVGLGIIVTWSNQLQHGYIAVQRTSRVALCLALCVIECVHKNSQLQF